jgi:hypothetical protein
MGQQGGLTAGYSKNWKKFKKAGELLGPAKILQLRK